MEGGRSLAKTQLNPGDFCLRSHDEINTPRWSNQCKFLAIALDSSFVNQSIQASTAITFQPQLGQSNPIIAQFAKRFQVELVARSYKGLLYGESLALAFALHLLERYCNQSQIPKPRGKLSALQLRQFVEYVHEHLSNDLSLVELANQLNLSSFHFARLVKNSLGLSPHQYVLQSRIEQAKHLMTSQDLSLAQIALQVGFYDHAHFTKAFKRMVGVSPKQFSSI